MVLYYLGTFSGVIRPLGDNKVPIVDLFFLWDILVNHCNNFLKLYLFNERFSTMINVSFSTYFQWQFETRPVVCGGAALIVTLRGIAFAEDKYQLSLYLYTIYLCVTVAV